MRTVVYIPNFNGARWLPRTLQSLRGQTERLDVVVVDNGSGDGSPDAVRADFPEVTLLELGENLGFGPALNRAVATYPADAIVLLNADVDCEPGFCAALLTAAGDEAISGGEAGSGSTGGRPPGGDAGGAAGGSAAGGNGSAAGRSAAGRSGSAAGGNGSAAGRSATGESAAGGVAVGRSGSATGGSGSAAGRSATGESAAGGVAVGRSGSATGGSVDMVAGVLLQEREPGLVDSAGVVADRTLMGFDHLHGEPVSALAGAADPLGPTGGAALYRRAAWEEVGGFDERIFLYYEDLDLALRIAARGGRCRLAPEARALHAYSASLGAASAAKYARTGWSRGYMLRRYGVMRHPAPALRVLATEGAIGLGQLLRDRTSAGIIGRLRGYRAGAGLPRRDVGAAPLLEMSGREALELRRRRRG